MFGKSYQPRCLVLKNILLTVQCEHWWNSLAVRHSSWIRYTILPQVGEVVWCGQDDAADFRPGPDLCWHRGTDQDPSRHTDNKAANLHVHHYSPISHFPPWRSTTRQREDTKLWITNCGTPVCVCLQVPPQAVAWRWKHWHTQTHTSGLYTSSHVLPCVWCLLWRSLWWWCLLLVPQKPASMASVFVCHLILTQMVCARLNNKNQTNKRKSTSDPWTVKDAGIILLHTKLRGYTHINSSIIHYIIRRIIHYIIMSNTFK